MPRLLIRSAKDPFLALTPEATLAANVIGNNSGNLLFGFAVHQMLATPDTEVVSNSFLTERPGVTRDYIDRINSEFDTFVIPLANAFRPSFTPWLDHLSEVIEQLSIPVVVVGVGAQLPATATEFQDTVKEPVTRFVRAVLDRSATIGVRGEITARSLASLGFGSEHVDVIGCPSLFLPGRDHQVVRAVPELTPDSPIAVNLTLTRPKMAAIIDRLVHTYPNMTYIPQETRELALMLWGVEPSPGVDELSPLRLDHPLYQQDRVRFFVDPLTWISFLRTQHFCFGSRIHGNIAALVAGTPASVLRFDSRTKELADYHAIPSVHLDDAAEKDPAELYAAADLDKFNERHPQVFDRYAAFLERNGLAHVHQPGQANPAFSERLEAVNFPPAVAPTLARPDPTSERILERLRWLRQGDKEDGRREMGAAKPTFPLSSKAAPHAHLNKRVAKLERELARLRRQVDARPPTPPAPTPPGRGIVEAARRRMSKLRRPKE